MKGLIRVLAAILIAFSAFLFPNNTYASANDFYFEDATFDYYLENTDSGTTMHVKEVLTAVFPNVNQNHGITRAIPFTNVDGKNITVENPNALNLKVTRNGNAETVTKIDKDEDEYIAYIGSANEYVTGKQVYTLEYDFHNVITEFTENGQNVTGQHSDNVKYQELYWDTNGTGWTQKFDHLTANLHLTTAQSKALLGNLTSCYVGRQGSSNGGGERISPRCTLISDDETTYNVDSRNSEHAISTLASASETILTFETSNLSPRENLTFAVAFTPKTFNVPDLPKNYALVIITLIVTLICAVIITIIALIYFKKAHKKKEYKKGLFEAPQYTPPKGLEVAESAGLYIKQTKNPYVATLLELAVSGKITIVKGEPTKVLKKDTWAIKLNNISDLTGSQTDLLKLLNGGQELNKADDGMIQIKKHTPTSTLAALSRDYYKDANKKLKGAGYLESSTLADKMNLTTSSSVGGKKVSSGGVIAIIIIMAAFVVPLFSILPNVIFSALSGTNIDLEHGIVVGKEFLPIVIPIIIIATVIASIILISTTVKYKKYTEKGLDTANYLDGLYLYINMAEADRLKFLQSAKGADTSKEGIVKLYEKLLPYACLFGLEESWLSELGKYCKEIDYSPTWYGGNEFITYYALSSMTRHVNGAISSSATYGNGYSNSGSGSSSFGSGIGGGGFSGGGGGGGGGGGW